MMSSKSWVSKSGLAVLDQGLFSVANFLVNILLARWLPSGEYGAFAVALSVYYLLSGFHTAVLTEPMMVFGAGKYKEHFQRYIGIVLVGHWLFAGIAAAVLLLAAFVIRSFDSVMLSNVLWGLALASPFLLFLLLARRGCYTKMRSGWSVLGSSVNLVVVLGGLWFLWQSRLLSASYGFLLLGAASGISAFMLMLLYLRPDIMSEAKNALPFFSVAKEHFRYGRWALGNAFLVWVPWNLAYTLLPWYTGITGSAQAKATMNFISPILQANMGLSLVILPYLASVYRRDGLIGLKMRTRKILAIFVGWTVSYGILLSIFRNHLINFVYGGRYSEISNFVLVASLLPVFASVCAVVLNALRALERPDLVFRAYIFSSLVVFVTGIALISHMGVLGAFLLMIVANLTLAAASAYYLFKVRL